MAGILIELGFEPLAQGEGVGRRAGEADDDLALAEPAHLAGVALDDGLAEAHLAVAGDHGLAALAHQNDGRSMHGRGIGSMRIDVSGRDQDSLTTPAHLLRRRAVLQVLFDERVAKRRVLLLIAAQPQGEGKKK